MKTHRLVWLAVLALCIFFLASAAVVVTADTGPQSATAIMGTATIDTYVKRGDTTPHGSEPFLIAEAQQPPPPDPCNPLIQVIFLQFQVPGTDTVPGTPGWTMKLWQYFADSAATIKLYSVPSNSWDGSLTYSTAEANGWLPQSTRELALATLKTANDGILEFTDSRLANYVNTNRGASGATLSFAVAFDACTGIAFQAIFASKENPDSGQCPNGPCPLSAEIASFEASAQTNAVVVEWTTASEIDTEGFNIYRSEAEGGQYVKINDALIPAQGNPSTGASYSFTDTDVKPGRTYYYKLEDVDTSGVSTFHGPVSATVRGKGR